MQKNDQKRKRIIIYLPELFTWLLVIAVWGVLAGTAEAGAYEELPFYRAAADIMSGGQMPPVTYHVSYAYLWTLALFMSFLGTKQAAVIVLWLFLQAVVTLLFFYGIRRLFGRTASVACLVFMAVLSKFLFGPQQIASGLFTGFLLALALPALSAVKITWKRKQKGKAVVFGLAAGLFAGAALCLSEVFDCLVFAAVFVLCACISGIASLIGSRRSLAVQKEREQNAPQEKVSAAEAEAVTAASSKAIQYIPNPLPLPKKHVKREIKFDYEPPLELMQFDHEMKKGQEDFDI